MPTTTNQPRAACWRVRVHLPDGMYTSSTYTYPVPIDERGVRTTPAVVAWVHRLGGTIEAVYPVDHLTGFALSHA